jgi:DHA1 family L-arabinose/isopropyl-beta-D-thiogalactopyranoside export protein-like MFS transporter
VIALALGAFVFNTSEFVPVGLLSSIGASFDMQVEQVGLMLTIYAWVVALASLPFMLLTRKVERRKLLMGVFAVFVLSHLLSGVAWSYASLVISRIGIALSHAVFWSITASLAVRVAPAGQEGHGIEPAGHGHFRGHGAGHSAGSHRGRMAGLAHDVSGHWRGGCGGDAGALLPRLPSENAGSCPVPMLFRRPALVGIYVLLVLVITGQFTAYSYIEPCAGHRRPRRRCDHGRAAAVWRHGHCGQRAVRLVRHALSARFLLASIGVLALSLLLLVMSSTHVWSLYLQSSVWGIAMICFALSMQSKVLNLAPDATDVAMSMFSGIFNIGIGGGALLGSIVSQQWGMTHIGGGRPADRHGRRALVVHDAEAGRQLPFEVPVLYTKLA